MTLFLGLLVGYIGVLIAISYYVGRSESDEDYLIAGRDRPWWQILFSKYAANVGAGYLLTQTAFAYEFGISLIPIVVTAIAGILIYAYYAAPRIYRVASEYRAYTQGDYVAAVTNYKPAQYLTNSAAAILALLIVVISVSGGATLMEEFGVLSYEVAVFLTLGIVLMYIYASGYKAVMITDVLQGLMMLVLLTVVAFGILSGHTVSSEVLLEARNLSPLGIIMISLFGIVGVFAYADRYQITYAAGDERGLKKGMAWVFVPIVYTSVLLYVIGNVVYSVDPLIGSSAVYVVAIQDFLPAALIPFAVIIFFAALMSSADSYVYVLASHTQIFIGEALQKHMLQIMTVLFGILVAALALVFREVVDLAIASAAVAFAISFPMIYLIIGYTDGCRFFAMLFLGLFGVVLGIITIGLVPDAAIMPFVCFLIGLTLPIEWIQGALDKVAPKYQNDYINK